MNSQVKLRFHFPSYGIRLGKGYVVGYDNKTQTVGIRLQLQNMVLGGWLIQGISQDEWDVFCKNEVNNTKWMTYWFSRGNLTSNMAAITFQGIWNLGNQKMESEESIIDYLARPKQVNLDLRLQA